MPAFSSHHCPKCGRVGNKHCIAAGHYVDCEIHPGSFHSTFTECVKCTHAKQREEQEERASLQKAKEEDDEEDKNQKKKKAKTPKAKPDSQKSMKQLRKEKKEKRRSESSQDSSLWYVQVYFDSQFSILTGHNWLITGLAEPRAIPEQKRALASGQRHTVTHCFDGPDISRYKKRMDQGSWTGTWGKYKIWISLERPCPHEQ